MRTISGFGSLRRRVTALLLLGAIPLAALAALLAWQDYRAAVSDSRENTALLQRSIIARHRAVLDQVRQELATIARSEGSRVDPSGCERLLSDALLLQRDRYAALEVADGYGRPTCRAIAEGQAPGFAAWLAAQDRWVQRAAKSRAFAAGALRLPDHRGGFLIGSAYPLDAGGGFKGAAVALMRADRLAGASASEASAGYQLWLFDPDTGLVPVLGADEPAFPEFKLTRIARGASEIITQLRASGRPWYLAAGDIGGGLRLVIARDPSASLAGARALLLSRLLGLALLLVLGIAAAAVGANLALVQPIERLTGAVERWRAGVPFDSFKIGRLTPELEGLRRAFAHATEVLGAREAELRRALEKQELLSQEIHHRVKNNLQVVASLLNLQASRIRQPEAKAEFQSARDRVRALATLHRHLYVQGEVQTINMRSFLKELCEQLFQALGPGATNRIRLNVDAPDLRIPSDKAVPLALIVTETVGNAIKYAFPGERRGRISVRLSPEPNGGARLVIEDDGVGLPEGRSDTETGIRDGIGLKLVHGLARQLGATLTVGERQGTRYEVTLPLLAEHVPSGEAET